MSDNRRSQAEMSGRRLRVDRGTVEGTPHARTSDKACNDLNRQPFEVTMEEVLSRENMLAAHKRVLQNGGAPGIDGQTVDDLWDLCVDQWEAIREQLLACPGRHQVAGYFRSGERFREEPSVMAEVSRGHSKSTLNRESVPRRNDLVSTKGRTV